MTQAEFDEVFEEVVERSRKVLCQKAKEYAEGNDRLHNFNVAAQVQGNDPITSLGGMMVKHIVSVYDLIRREAKGQYVSKELFDEKIGDSINYLILLTAILVEKQNTKEVEERELIRLHSRNSNDR